MASPPATGRLGSSYDKGTGHDGGVHITAEEVVAGCRGGGEGIGGRGRTGDDLPHENWRRSALVRIHREVMRDGAVHVVEVNCHRCTGRYSNRAHIEGDVLSSQVNGGRLPCR